MNIFKALFYGMPKIGSCWILNDQNPFEHTYCEVVEIRGNFVGYKYHFASGISTSHVYGDSRLDFLLWRKEA